MTKLTVTPTFRIGEINFPRCYIYVTSEVW